MVDKENSPPTIRQYPLERRKILKRYVSSEFGKLVLWAVISVVLFLISLSPQLSGSAFLIWIFTIVLLVAYSIVNWWYQNQYFESYYYDIRKNFLVIKKGVFMPRETTLPFDKLQDVYLDQDFWDRLFSLWDLHVSTATISSGFHAHIDGVSKENAELMREMLLSMIKKEQK